MFYDKLEKSVLFLHNIWKTRDKSIDSRAVQHLLQNPPVSDGGQFSMFLDLVEKYGCVPVEVYPDSVHASRTKELNELLATILRYFAKQVRQSENEVNFQKLVNQAVHTVYELLTCALGSPPEEFEFNSQKFTPLQFYRNVLEPRDLDEYVVLVNVPQSDRPMNQPYEVSSLGSMVGGRAVRYLNVDLETMIFCVTQTLDMDLRVWFGSFVNDCRHEKEGLLDTEAFDCGYQVLLGLDVCLDRSERLRYRQSAVTHAMVFSGYHVDAATGRAKSFRVENSWGPTHKEGYFDMTRKWFERNVYEVAVPPSVVPADLLRLWLSGKPRELPMWDPLGMLLGPECC
jgi:bleomycin hydrolase